MAELRLPSPRGVSAARAEPKPLPANITGVQPGLGVCCRIEMAWGRLRRWWLATFRREYVRRMAELRRGDDGLRPPGAPHEILDPRDLKFCRNRCGVWWEAADDPFRWRDRLGFARWGLAELQLMGWPLLATAAAIATWGGVYRPLAAVPAVVLALVVFFFRDPSRTIPSAAGAVVSPADGKVVEITRLEHDEFVGGPAVRIGIFLSIFNVHVNRAPERSRVIELRYAPGKFLNAMKPESARENECLWIGLECEDPPHRRLSVRQISGAIARRIVCDLAPGQVIDRGFKFGMIKLGSRTELVLPDEDELELLVQFGSRVSAGSSLVARYRDAQHTP